MLDDLRERTIQAEMERELEEEQQRQRVRRMFELAPWQRFILAVLLFLNVALLGCMCLAAFGRIVPPF